MWFVNSFRHHVDEVGSYSFRVFVSKENLCQFASFSPSLLKTSIFVHAFGTKWKFKRLIYYNWVLQLCFTERGFRHHFMALIGSSFPMPSTVVTCFLLFFVCLCNLSPCLLIVLVTHLRDRQLINALFWASTQKCV